MKIRWVCPQVVIFQIMINLLRPVVIRVCFENNQIFKFGILAIIFLLLSLLLFQNINLTVWNCRYTQSTKKRRTRNQFTVNTIANFCCRKELTQKWSALLYPRMVFWRSRRPYRPWHPAKRWFQLPIKSILIAIQRNLSSLECCQSFRCRTLWIV